MGYGDDMKINLKDGQKDPAKCKCNKKKAKKKIIEKNYFEGGEDKDLAKGVKRIKKEEKKPPKKEEKPKDKK